MYIVDITSLGFSLLAIILTIVMYYKHDKRLKEQEAKLNAYQIKKIEEEEFDNRKAQVRGNIIKGDKGRRDIRIYNTGKAPAKNIYITFLDKTDENMIIMKYPSPYEFLNIGDHFDIIVHLYIGSPDILKMKLIWEDDFSSQNEHLQHFKLT